MASFHVRRFRFNSFKELFSKEFEDDKNNFDPHTGLPKLKFKTRPGKRGGGFSGGGYRSGHRSSYSDYSPRQLCTFKASHRYDKALNKKHLAYIQKEGKGRNGSDPELYGADPDNYESRMSKLHYRWIISPDNPSVDLNLLIENFMDKVEDYTGYKLDWVATNHYKII